MKEDFIQILALIICTIFLILLTTISIIALTNM